MKLGIFGFSKVGKTTLFNLLTRLEVATDKFSTARAAPNVGAARVADPRVDRLVAMFKPKKTTFAAIQYVDVAGIKKGELGTKDAVDLNELRPVDAIVHVVRAFADDEIEHGPGKVDPRRDIQAMEEELVLADHIAIERRLERLVVDIKKRKDAKLEKEHELLARLLPTLEKGVPLRTVEVSAEEEPLIRGFQFLSRKPILHVINLGEERKDDCENLVAKLGLEDVAGRPRTAVTYVLGKLEQEISQLEEADAKEFLKDLGLTESGIDRIVRTSYGLLGLISFFTVGEDEVRAWTIDRGTTAEDAAGTIHSDIKRGFIRAEVMSYDELITRGSAKAVKDAGLFRLEGRTYVVKDGEIAHFRFAV